MPAKIESEFEKWATSEAQRRCLHAWEECGRSSDKAARQLKVSGGTVRNAISKIKLRAAAQGYSPDHDYRHAVPDGFLAKGVSSLYDGEGNLKSQWVKSVADNERQNEILREAFEAMADELPRRPRTTGPKVQLRKDLATQYTIADGHLGMLSWPDETGDRWDLEEGERVISEGVRYLAENSPPAHKGIVVVLGDFLHYDSLQAVTPTSHHVLDADSRFGRVAQVAVRTIRSMVDAALEKHREVVLIVSEGNHDLASSMWLRIMFAALYEKEPRVEVVQNELPYYSITHGRTFLGYHHGHLKAIKGRSGSELALIFANTEDWSKTHGGRRYIHTGHLHDAEESSVHGARLMQHPTIAGRDAYAARHGYRNGRELRAITYHSEFGEVGRVSVTAEMLAGV